MSILTVYLFLMFVFRSGAVKSGSDITPDTTGPSKLNTTENFTASTNQTGVESTTIGTSNTTMSATEQGNHSMKTTDSLTQQSIQTDGGDITDMATAEQYLPSGNGSTSSVFPVTFGNMTTINSTGIPVQTTTPKQLLQPPTRLPDIIQDIDEDLVAGMSILVVVIFGVCFGGVIVKHYYGKRSRKDDDRGVFYEEVEDAATSCSIEGSSNIKFLVGRARNINKSRIEQINEEWMKEKPHLDHENDIKANGRKISTPDQPETDLRRFSVDSEINSGQITAEEDSEYATAEPMEDIYSMAEETVSESTSENQISLNKDIPPPVPNNKRPSMKKLQRTTAFDDGEEDPYEETPEDEYDLVHSPRAHKPPNLNCLPETPVISEAAAEEDHMYEITDDVTYESVDDDQKKMDGIHRSKAQPVLFRKSKSSFPDNENMYQGSFDDEYDVLNKPRFRLTGSSDNYDNVVLSFESEEKPTASGENRISVSFADLERKERSQSNLYSDIPVNKENKTDYPDNEDLSETLIVKQNSDPSECVNKTSDSLLHDKNCNNEIVEDEGANEIDILNLLHQRNDQDDRNSLNSSHSSICDLLGIVETTLSTSDVENKNYTFENKCYDTILINGNIGDSKTFSSDIENSHNNEFDTLIDNANSV